MSARGRLRRVLALVPALMALIGVVVAPTVGVVVAAVVCGAFGLVRLRLAGRASARPVP